MCYPKPGPRCSAHAAAAYAKAHQKVLHAFMNNKKDPELNRLVKLREKAKAEYDITPAGIQEKERQYEKNKAEWAKRELDEVKQERQRRLDAVKGQQPATHTVRGNRKYLPTTPLETGQTPEEMSYNHPNLLASMKLSEQWSHSLTDEEMETVAWYSQDGYAEINGYLSNPADPQLRYTNEQAEKTVQTIDKALAKYSTTEPVTVYRRHLMWNKFASYEDLTSEQIQERFKPGDTYIPHFYLSTSMNADNLPSQDKTVIGMEIVTKSGVPITSISSQGPREYEVLIPRNTKFRVVSNDVKVKRYDRIKKQDIEVVVIRLEEI